MKIPKIFDLASKPDFHVDELKDISNRNIRDAKEFLVKSAGNESLDFENVDVGSNVDINDLRKIILNPEIELPVENPLKNIPNLNSIRGDDNLNINKKKKFQPWIRRLDYKKQQEIERSLFLAKQQEETSMSKKQRIYFLDSIGDGIIESTLRHSDIRCAMLITDTIYTRTTKMYKDIVNIFNIMNINFVEYTNVQPELDRRLIFKMSEFAHDHGVNAMFVVGACSTVELMRVVMTKIINPNILSLHKKRQWNESLASQYYIFSFPTFVTIEDGVNSRSALKNNVLFPEINFLGDTIFLNDPKDDSHSVFFYSGVFDVMSRDKIKEVLHETFFRLLINYFDLSLSIESLENIINRMKTIQVYLEIVYLGQDLDDEEKKNLLKIISTTLDGSSMVYSEDFWVWYRLESSLSLLVNSSRSDGLALFLPVYLEVLSQNSIEFSNRAIDLGTRMFGSYSVEGLIFKLMLHIKKYNLPVSLLDISQIKKVDWKFLAILVKKSSSWTLFNKLTKTIVKNLTVW